MAYKDSINSNIYNVSKDAAIKFFIALNWHPSQGTYKDLYSKSTITYTDYLNIDAYNSVSNNFDNLYDTNGNPHVIKNTLEGKDVYNLYDLIASAKAAKVTNTDIATALNAADIPKVVATSSGTYRSRSDADWENTDVKALNINTTPYARQLQEHLDKTFPNVGAYVSVIQNANGNSYDVRVVYPDPNQNNNLVYVSMPEPKNGVNSEYKAKEFSDVFTNANIGTTMGNVALTLKNQSAEQEARRKEEEARKKEIEAAKTELNNINTSNNAINNLLGTLNSTSGTALDNLKLSNTDKQAMTVQTPNKNVQAVGNQVNNSAWIKNLGDNLLTEGFDTVEGDSIEDYSNRALTKNELLARIANTQLDKASTELLSQIKSNPQLLDSLLAQQRTAFTNNLTAGNAVANAQALAAERDSTLKEQADEVYRSMIGGDNDVAAQLRSETTQNFADALSAYTDQQLNKLIADQQSNAIDVASLTSVRNAIKSLIDAENSAAVRLLNDSKTKAETNANQIMSNKDAASLESIAASEARAKEFSDNASNLINLQQQSSNQGLGPIKPPEPLKGDYTSSTGYREKYTYETPNYDKETTYNTLADSEGIRQALSKPTYDRLTNQKSALELAQEYGLAYLLDADVVAEAYKDFARQGNEASDKVFNNAQRAYLSALAAGDTTTIEQLSKLAQVAGTSKQNLHVASALQEQMQQQQQQRNVGNNLISDTLLQRMANDKAIVDAEDEGRRQQTAWLGNGNENGNGFYTGAYLHDQNVAGAKDAYSQIAGLGMSSQSTRNDLISDANNSTADIISKAAADITKLNAQANASNKTTTATLQGGVNALNTQKAVNDAAKLSLQKIIKNGL